MKILILLLLSYSFAMATGSVNDFNGLGALKLNARVPTHLIDKSKGSGSSGSDRSYSIVNTAPYNQFGAFPCSYTFQEKNGVIYFIGINIECKNPDSSEFKKAFKEITGFEAGTLNGHRTTINGNGRILNILSTEDHVILMLTDFKSRDAQ